MIERNVICKENPIAVIGGGIARVNTFNFRFGHEVVRGSAVCILEVVHFRNDGVPLTSN